MRKEKRSLVFLGCIFVSLYFGLCGFISISNQYMEKWVRTSKITPKNKQAEIIFLSPLIVGKTGMVGYENDFYQHNKQLQSLVMLDQKLDFHLPFEDNFNNGLREEWKLKSIDKPILNNGMLTAKFRKEVCLEIGDTELNNYALEFDVFYDPKGDGSSITFFVNSSLKVVVSPWLFNPTRLTWYEFIDNEWQIIDNKKTSLLSKESERWKIIRNGDKYQIFRNGEVINTFQYGSETGDPIMVRIGSNEIMIDNFRITEKALTD